MSVIQKGLKKAGIELPGDMPPTKQRGGRWWQRAIAALRAAEAAELDLKAEAERQLNEVLRENLDLRNDRERLRAELQQYRLKEKLGEIEALTVSDRTRLLQLSGPAANGG